MSLKSLSKYWSEEESSTWRLLNFDMYMVNQTPDISKDKAHNKFKSDTEKLAKLYSTNSDMVSSMKILQKEFTKRHKNKAVNEFWSNHKNKAAAQTIESKLTENNLQNAIKESIASTLRIGTEAQRQNETTSGSSAGSSQVISTNNAGQANKRPMDNVGGSQKTTKRRKINLFKSGGQKSSSLEIDNLRWYINGIDISGTLMEMRDKTMASLTNKKNIIANFIFYFTERFEDSMSKILGR
ncbi:hypothetical protein BDC45DRAFT_342197 [Circinella umbellata]|nr:hypothetical protein BDC45DRAFT_342197 [Circinella umbellata]